MPINVPESLFDKYYDVIDSTFDIFGVKCELVSINKVEEVVYNPNNNIPNRNSINSHRTGGGTHDRGTKTIKETEVLSEIKLKVYWEPKQWIGVTNTLVIPDGSIQTLGFMSDLPKILAAKQLIVHQDIKDYKVMRFERINEPIPVGLRQNRYFACMWKRA